MTSERYPLGPVGPHYLYRVKTTGEEVVIARELQGNHIFRVFQGLAAAEPVDPNSYASLHELYEGLVVNRDKEYENHAKAKVTAEWLDKCLDDTKRELGNRALLLISSQPHDFVSASVLKAIRSVERRIAPIVGRYDDGPTGTMPRKMRIRAFATASTDDLESGQIGNSKLGPLDAMDYDFKGDYALPDKWTKPQLG